MKQIASHYNCWRCFNRRVYRTTLNAEHIMKNGNEQFIETVFKIKKEGHKYVVEENVGINTKCILMERRGVRYILPVQYVSSLPINVKESFDCFLRKSDRTIYRFIVEPSSVRISPERTMGLKQLIKVFNPLEHTDERTWIFLKLQAIGSKWKGGKYRLCSPPECVDGDTEFLTQTGWKKISEYEHGDSVMQYNLDRTAELVKPFSYIKQPCGEMYHIKNKYLDQMLSSNHKVLYVKRYNSHLGLCTAKELVEKHKKNIHGFEGLFITSFKNRTSLSLNYHSNLNPFDLRLLCAIIADGTYTKGNKVVMRLKKERKKVRLRKLLERTNTYHTEHDVANGYTHFRFDVLWAKKEYSWHFWLMGIAELKIIANECLYWDGDRKNRFFTTSKKSADFIQYCFTSLGYKASIQTIDRRGRKKGKYITKSIDYVVHITTKSRVSLHNPHNKNKIMKVKPKDGYQYCFNVPSGYLVLRRNNKIFITGNSGKNANDIIIHTITNDNVTVSKPTLAKLETLFYYYQKVICNEITSLTSAQVREVEPFFLNVADESPVFHKHSMAQKKDMNEVDISNSSLIFTYNDKASLHLEATFFDDVFANMRAMDSRYPALYIEGRITSELPKLSMVEAKQIVEENFEEMKTLAKNLVYYFKNMNKELHKYNRSKLMLKGRKRINFECVIDAIDVYCSSQDEFDEFMLWINDRVKAYITMVNEEPIKGEEEVK